MLASVASSPPSGLMDRSNAISLCRMRFEPILRLFSYDGDRLSRTPHITSLARIGIAAVLEKLKFSSINIERSASRNTNTPCLAPSLTRSSFLPHFERQNKRKRRGRSAELIFRMGLASLRAMKRGRGPYRIFQPVAGQNSQLINPSEITPPTEKGSKGSDKAFF